MACEERVLWELMGKQEKNFDGSVTKEEARKTWEELGELARCLRLSKS